MKKVIGMCIVLAVFFSGSAFAVVGQTNQELVEYKAKTDQINQEMKQGRGKYKKGMQALDKKYVDKFNALGKDDKSGRKALQEKKREEKKARQIKYRKNQTALREQVMAIQQTRKGVRVDKVKADQAAKKAKKTEKKAVKKAEK